MKRRLDGIRHEGEISRLLSIAKQKDRRALAQAGDHAADQHIGSLTGHIHCEEPHGENRHSIVVKVRETKLLCRQLAHPIRRDGFERIVLAHWEPFYLAIDRRRGSENKLLEVST